MSINKRVELLISKSATSKSSFSTATGISSVILSHISSGRNKVSLTAVEQILKAYPQVNAEWLVLGKGQMFKDGVESNALVDIDEKIKQLEVEIDNQKMKLAKSISELKSVVDQLKQA